MYTVCPDQFHAVTLLLVWCVCGTKCVYVCVCARRVRFTSNPPKKAKITQVNIQYISIVCVAIFMYLYLVCI